VRIDHVIYAAADLDAAAARVERELGLSARGGGRHEGLGTHNRIVPLGGGYLELLAVADPDEAAGSDFGRGVMAHLAEAGDGLLNWVVAVDDVDPVARRLGTTITTIRRSGMSARLTGLAEAVLEPFLPFFISRDPGVADPGGVGDAGGITWIEVAGDASRLEHWVESSALPVRVVEGLPAVLAFGIGEQRRFPVSTGADGSPPR
jgi:Glyoxalase-like domain